MGMEAFRREAHQAGRNEGPALLFDWWYGHMLTVEELRVLLPEVWELAEFPAASLGRATWIDLFRMAGYCSSPPGLPAPVGPLTVYRGCTRGRQRAMSWTTGLSQARWFAQRFTLVLGKPSMVVTMEVPPALVLARCEGRDGGPGTEAEIVVDCLAIPRGAIRPVDR